MNSIKTWLIEIVSLVALLLGGCAVHPRIVLLEPHDRKEAFEELLRISAQLERFSANATFELSSSSGNFQFKGHLDLVLAGSSRIEIVGPLGVKVAELQMDSDMCRLDLPHLGQSITVSNEEELMLPQLGLPLPGAGLLLTWLWPLPSLESESYWTFAPTPEDSSNQIRLQHRDPLIADSLIIRYRTQPFQPIGEERWRNCRWWFSREFAWSERLGYLPTNVTIEYDKLKLKVRYTSVNAYWKTK